MAQSLLEAARLAVRKTTTNLDTEIVGLIKAGIADMRRKNIVVAEGVDDTTDINTIDPLILRQLMLYCQFSFGIDGDVDKKQRIERIYEGQCVAMSMSKEYRAGDAGG